ncbi:MAG: hypothetical protein J6J17_05725 [Bacilli bacterium]|nr:hypothetical protein [Bacilli bacterium]
MEENKKILVNLMNRYNLSMYEKYEFVNIVYPIFKHKEFQRRMTNEFKHHENTTLGYHILQVSIQTYLNCKKKINNGRYIDIRLSVIIAMLHDLYELPWQNNPHAYSKKIIHRHGFRHPIEAVINAIVWYPELFKNTNDAKIIIDGILHHMYPPPLPCIYTFDENIIELKNYNKINKIPESLRKIIINSTNRGKIGKVSICMSKYFEGRIACIADTSVSFSNFDSLQGTLSLLTGKNSKL